MKRARTIATLVAASALILQAPVALAEVARAETGFSALTPQERALFQQETRRALLAMPELVLPAFEPPNAMQAGISADQQMLARLSPVLTAQNAYKAGPDTAPAVVLISRPNCPACLRARDWLTKQAVAGRLRLYEWDLSSPALAPLELDAAPSFIFDQVILRGDMPDIVLQKYLAKITR